MRRITTALIGRSAFIAGLVGALVAGVFPATAHASASTAVAGVDAEQAAPAPRDITVGNARNRVTGDVLGLGYEQVIRFDGPDVIITEPAAKGGAELRRFPAGASSSWPEWDDDGIPFTGQNDLVWFVRHEASRIAVLGDDVYVSRLLKPNGVWGAEVAKYTTDGVQQTTRWDSRSASTGAHALRFLEGGDGTGYLLIVRDAANGVESFEIGTRSDQGDWVTVSQGSKADLPAALAGLEGS